VWKEKRGEKKGCRSFNPRMQILRTLMNRTVVSVTQYKESQISGEKLSYIHKT